jgi:ribose transport system substrate-binding protein
VHSTHRGWLGSVLLVAALALCTIADAAEPGKPKVALVMKSLANEFFQTMQAGAREHQRQHAAQYELISNGIKDEIDTSGQIRLIEQMLAQRVQALVVAPADSKAIVPVLQMAISKGVVVINIDNRLDPSVLAEKHLTIPFVGPDNRAGAKLAGDFLAKQLAPNSQVGILEGIITTLNAQQRTLGFKDAMQAAGMKVVAVQSAEWQLQKGTTVAAAMLREHPDLAALLCGNDTMALGAIAAVKSASKIGRVKVVGYDNIPAVKPLLADGRMTATVDQFAGKQAVFGIEVALAALANKTPQNALTALEQTEVALITK